MYNSILCRYHEIAIKGNNRKDFERCLVDNLYVLLRAAGMDIKIHRVQGRIWIERPDRAVFTSEELETLKERLKGVFGIESFSPALYLKPDMAEITEAVLTGCAGLLPSYWAINDPVTFRIRARRSDKSFPLTSKDIEIALVEAVGGRFGGREHLKLNLAKAEFTIGVEVRKEFAVVFFESFSGPGGLPVGSNGKVLLLLSGGIDSPVAAYLLMKRGSPVDYLAFHSAPYTPEATTDKVSGIAKYLNSFQKSGRLNLANLSEFQKLVRDYCRPKYRTILYRRAMMRIANIVAERTKALALATGESLGQVASQTVVNLNTINQASNLAVLRPLIGFDKNETIDIARRIGTYELSEVQVPDSCTVFLPSAPATAAALDKVEHEEARIPDYDGVLEKIADEIIVSYPGHER